METLAVVGERTRSHIGHIRTDASDAVGFEVGVLSHKLGYEVVLHAQQVMQDQHLAIATRASADADSWDVKCSGDQIADLAGHTFEHNRKAACGLQRLGFVDQEVGCLGTFTLNSEATHCVHRLRRKPDMAHDRNLGIDHCSDHWNTSGTAFEFDGASARSDQLGSVTHGVFDRYVVAHPWQVAHDQLFWFGSGNSSCVIGHVVDRDRQGVAVAEYDHGQGVSDQDHVGVGLADHASRWIVSCSNHHDRFCSVCDLA